MKPKRKSEMWQKGTAETEAQELSVLLSARIRGAGAHPRKEGPQSHSGEELYSADTSAVLTSRNGSFPGAFVRAQPANTATSAWGP